jgi:hypothetical protein
MIKYRKSVFFCYWDGDVILFLNFFPLLLCGIGIHCGIYKAFYNVSNILCLNSPHPLIPGIVSARITFAFIYMCTNFLHHIHPPIPFSHHIPPSTGANPNPGQHLFYHSLALQFCSIKKRKEQKKNMTF